MHAVTRTYRGALGELGITYPQYLVLLALWDHETLTVGGLSRTLDLDSPTLTLLLKRMAASGLVTRRRDSDDGRVVHVRLTARAHALREGLAQAQAQVVCATGLAPTEFARLRDSLHRLSRTLAAHRERELEGNFGRGAEGERRRPKRVAARGPQPNAPRAPANQPNTGGTNGRTESLRAPGRNLRDRVRG